MSSLEPVKSVYDAALRPRILRTITREDLPDEEKPLEAPSKLSRIVSAVQTHRLLSESHAAADAKLTERWKIAVDDWVGRLLSLVSSSLMPDKCWAGICLLGVTCQECSSERFLASYGVWFDKLLMHVQSPADSQFVKVASFAAMSDLITSGPKVSAPNIHERTPMFVKIAALEALEALLTVGGAIKSESWRSKVDHVLIKLASNSCKRGFTNEDKGASLLHGSPSIYLEFQLAALRALFASVLSPTSVRPPHLARALELFRAGKREAATRTSEFCTFALFSLEVLIHPRGLPIETFRSGMQEDHGLSDSDDGMHVIESSKDAIVPLEVPHNITEKLGPDTFRMARENKNAMLQPSGAETLNETDHRPASATLDSELIANDKMMVESIDLQESRPQREEPVPSSVESRHREATYNQQPGSKETPNAMPATSPAGRNVESDIADDKATANKHEGFTHRDTEHVNSGNESDDTFPDIVDAEPDSD